MKDQQNRMRLRVNNRIVSILLAIILVLQLFPVSLYADDPDPSESLANYVVYVDGVGSGAEDGTTRNNAFQYLSEAYGVFASSLEAGERAVIVIAGPVSISSDTGLAKPANRADAYALPAHQGLVVLTSKYDEEDYTSTGTLAFNNKVLHLFGDTKLEKLVVSSALATLYGGYHAIHFGKGISSSASGNWVVKDIYGGTNVDVGLAAPINHTSIRIESGKYDNVYGGGSYYQGVILRAKNYSSHITMDGGTVSNIYGTGLGNTDNPHQKSVKIDMNGGTVGNIYGAHKEGTVYEGVEINITGGTVTTAVYGANQYVRPPSGSNTSFTPTLYGSVTVAVYQDATIGAIYGSEAGANVVGERTVVLEGFGTEEVLASPGSTLGNADVLKLNHSNLKLGSASTDFWSSLDGLKMTDDSRLKLEFNPGALPALGLSVLKSQARYVLDVPLITAPYGTANLFALQTPFQYSLGYEPGDGSTDACWQLSPSSSDAPADYVVYVDGVGSGDEDGTSRNHAFQYLSEAYGAFANSLKAGEKAVIVIAGPVSISSDTGLAKPANRADAYALPAHQGLVVLTSQYDEEDYTSTGSLAFSNKVLHLFGDTKLEKLVVSSALATLFGGYHAIHFGKGISSNASGNWVVKDIYGGTNADVGLATPINHTSIRIESGKYDNVYGGGSYYQGTILRAKNYSSHITLDGGTVSNIFGTGSGNTDNPHQKSVKIDMNGGTVGNINGAHKEGTVYEGVEINIKGGTVTAAVYGANPYVRPPSGSNMSYTPTLYGNVTVAVYHNATAGSIYGSATGANVVGERTVVLDGFGTEEELASPGSTLGNADVLKLSHSYLRLDSTNAAFWSSLDSLKLTDDSRLKLEFNPGALPALGLSVLKTQDQYVLDVPLITAPYGTANLFTLQIPFQYSLGYEPGDGSTDARWQLSDEGFSIGQRGADGMPLDVDLGLPTSYDAELDGESVFHRYEQRLEELGDAAEAANVIVPAVVQGEVEIYVAPDGSDTNSGSKLAPLRTIQKALSYIPLIRASLNVKGIVIYLREGTYISEEPIVLGEQHSGTNESPVILSAYLNEEVHIASGVEISGDDFSPVTDESVRERLPSTALDHIVVTDLRALGITDYGSIVSGRPGGPTYQVFMDGEAMRLARYPNVTKLPLGKVLDIGPVTASYSSFAQGTNASSTGIEFVEPNNRPFKWLDNDNIWLNGSLFAEWDTRNLRISDIKQSSSSIKLAGGTTLGALSGPDQTYYYYNVLEEMDVPGEFFLDTVNGLLYMYPMHDLTYAKVTFVSKPHDIVQLKGTRNVVLNGLNIEYGGKNGIVMDNNNYKTVIQNSTVQYVAQTGVVIAGKKSGLIQSTIHDTGNNPASFTTDSDYFDYTPDQNFLQNSYIYNTGRLNPEYGYVHLNGVGNVVSHNLIQGTYGVSIYTTNVNESIVEYNEIVGGPVDTYDSAAIYAIGFPVSKGNHYRYNYIHDIGISSESYNPHGIYFDESSSENYVYGNVMNNIPTGFFTNSGGDNVVTNNIVMHGRSNSIASIWGSSNFDNFTLPQRLLRAPLLQSSYNLYQSMSSTAKAALSSRQPALCDYYDKMGEVLAERATLGSAYVITAKERELVKATGNTFIGNISYDHKNIIANGTNHTVEPNLVTDIDPFVDSVNGDFSLKSGVELEFAYKPIPFEQIGIIGTKRGIGDFNPYGPSNGSHGEVYSGDVLLQWTPAAGADHYIVTVATDEVLTQDVRVIDTEKPYHRLANDAYFQYDHTYYWTVTAATYANSRIGIPVSHSQVYSFTTMSFEEYLAANKADTANLELAIIRAVALVGTIEEGIEPGQYVVGAKSTLEAAIVDAELIMAEAESKLQEEVNTATETLWQAIQEAITQRNIAFRTFDTDLVKWSETGDAVPPRIAVTHNVYELSMGVTGSVTEIVYKEKVDLREILTFDFYLEDLEQWNGFVIRQSSKDVIATKVANTDSYFIVIKGDQLELQKRNGGISYGNLAVVSNNDVILTSGQWYNIELGAVNESGGTVHVSFKVDGVTVFDYVDTTNPIMEAGYFGIVLQEANGIAKLRAADSTPPTE
ncbi:right-handed parallel beta-helix repeat-containing protein [Paenibacillus oryzisoli]|uniref:Right handed beta helix domain-containing protein n=1 Tax=Paenibacillus oryzisoli TaxID=1850517 RepID=A0A198A5M2_9BACL|nr:right-handed parallel beta-helix repeat-containing protein [Paenibacillus oryzisoli]OAS16420.1 hypothetical protein A8708_20645 [Paenibacillus oryzisoli]